MTRKTEQQLKAAKLLKNNCVNLKNDYLKLKKDLINTDIDENTLSQVDITIKECKRIIKYYNNRIKSLESL